jgi:hypothetical protein
MIVVRKHEDAAPGKRAAQTSAGLTFDVTPYFGITVADAGAAHPEIGELHPVAVRIDQPPDTVNAPHFHQANQFQVFVDGAGSVGKHRVDGIAIHYAQAYSPYGPLCAGERGLSYFVLRNSWDPIAQFMPAKRALLKTAGRRPRAVISPALEPAPPLGAGVRCTPALEPAADGLAAWRIGAPAGARFTGPDPASGGGQFWIPLAGSDRMGDDTLTPLSCAFISPDEPPHAGEAGPAGLDVLILQFPRLDGAHYAT